MKKKSNMKPRKAKSGPKPERLRIDGDWKSAVATALRKPKPPEGWPKQPHPYEKISKANGQMETCANR